ncbi:type II toxin-antitoxin system HicB family antitoxin [Vulgatibacter sp.]|uniref:type II toxin-antitoxin system HicB family antitoxin n=1 Tax=Vulgatibacter sp. TaxID=1971226 RepID=UPI003569E613
MKPSHYSIHVTWSEEDDCFVARVPALPGCAAHGASAAEATANAEDAAALLLEVMAEHGEPPPTEDSEPPHSGNIRLRLPRSLHGRLDALAHAEGVSLNQLMVALLAEGIGYRAAAAGEGRALAAFREAEPPYGAGTSSAATKPNAPARRRTRPGK